SNYIDEVTRNGLVEKTYYDFNATFNPNTALELNSTYGNSFHYESNDYRYFNGIRYIAGEYNTTLSQYHNKPASKYWVAKDGSKIDANGSTGVADLTFTPTSVPTGINSTIINTVKQIDIIENNTTKYSFTSDDILRHIFNDFNEEYDSSHHNNYSYSSDVNITHKIDYKIIVPYNVPPTYSIQALNMPNWLHSTAIDDKTLVITADNVNGVSDCYDIQSDVNGKRSIERYCIDIQ
ncbi:MAG: hypothetical protein KAU90_00575, partial [Sulfurovaceae bacterium]|nr:hypothetical protein [Sulfurovaceae bacterium]